MSIISSIEEHIKNAEGEVRAWWQNLVGKAQNDKVQAQSDLESEIAKGSEELKTAWAKFKIHL